MMQPNFIITSHSFKSLNIPLFGNEVICVGIFEYYYYGFIILFTMQKDNEEYSLTR